MIYWWHPDAQDPELDFDGLTQHDRFWLHLPIRFAPGAQVNESCHFLHNTCSNYVRSTIM